MKQKGNYSLYRRQITLEVGKKRKKPREVVVYYYRTYDSDGNRTPGRSTGQQTITAARTYVENLLKRNTLLTKGELTFGKFSENWFLWDKCSYVKDRSSRIGKTYVEGQRSYLENHILPAFKSMRLSAITRDKVRRWLHGLPETQSQMGRPLSKTTANHCLRILKLMLSEAEEDGYIQKNPARNVSKLENESKKRILLTLDEFQTLFREETLETVWGDETHYTINLIAATTGMRVGELQALQFCNIQDKHLDVLHSLERKYGIKSTKTKTERFVTTFSRTQKWIKSRIDKRPVHQEDDFIFSGRDRSTPIPYRTITNQFYSALDRIGITESIRQERGITFHSWRHFFITHMREARLPGWKLRILAGHKSSDMTDRYTSLTPNDFDDVRGIQEEIFGSNSKKAKEKE